VVSSLPVVSRRWGRRPRGGGRASKGRGVVLRPSRQSGARGARPRGPTPRTNSPSPPRPSTRARRGPGLPARAASVGAPASSEHEAAPFPGLRCSLHVW